MSSFSVGDVVVLVSDEQATRPMTVMAATIVSETKGYIMCACPSALGGVECLTFSPSCLRLLIPGAESVLQILGELGREGTGKVP